MIVLGVLGFFIYKPILNLLDSRAERIRKAMEDAKKVENQMQDLDKMRLEEMKKLDAESGAYFERVRRQRAAVSAFPLNNDLPILALLHVRHTGAIGHKLVVELLDGFQVASSQGRVSAGGVHRNRRTAWWEAQTSSRKSTFRA